MPQADLIKACKERGMEVYACSYLSGDVAEQYADHFSQINIVDADAIEAYAKENQVEFFHSGRDGRCVEARELIKIAVLQNCDDDPRSIAAVLAERTHSEVVQVIGRKIVLYKEGRDNKKRIEQPK